METATQHHDRLRAALSAWAIPQWPFPGPAGIRETAVFGSRVDVHVINNWCWLGTACDDGELGRLIEAPPRPMFDADIARLLMRTLARRKHQVIPLPAASADGT